MTQDKRCKELPRLQQALQNQRSVGAPWCHVLARPQSSCRTDQSHHQQKRNGTVLCARPGDSTAECQAGAVARAGDQTEEDVRGVVCARWATPDKLFKWPASFTEAEGITQSHKRPWIATMHWIPRHTHPPCLRRDWEGEEVRSCHSRPASQSLGREGGMLISPREGFQTTLERRKDSFLEAKTCAPGLKKTSSSCERSQAHGDLFWL